MISQTTSGSNRSLRTSDKGESVLRFRPGQAARRFDDSIQCFAALCADAVVEPFGDRAEFLGGRQVMVDDEERPLEFDRQLQHRRQDDEDDAFAFAARKLPLDRLDDVDPLQEPMEVPQHDDRGAVGLGQRRRGADRRQRIHRRRRTAGALQVRRRRPRRRRTRTARWKGEPAKRRLLRAHE